MTDRGLPGADGSPACPFVAFADDRDRRGDRPDHRHRCFAEPEPAPRALAHQEAYCLSSAFPVCPVFQEWARREAAHATHVADDALTTAAADDPDEPAAPRDAIDAPPLWGEEADLEPERPHVDRRGAAPDDDADDDSEAFEPRPRRNPPRDWAAPPPWAGGAGAGSAGGTGGRRHSPAGDGSEPDVAAEFLAGRSGEGSGLAGSAADRLASGEPLGRQQSPEPAQPRDARPPREPSDSHPPMPRIASYRDRSDSPAAPADPELAGLVGGGPTGPTGSAPVRSDAGHDDGIPERRSGRRPSVSSTRDRAARERDRAREVAERAGPTDGPSWERQRRYEAYPTIKTRAGLSGVTVPRIAVLVGALAVAAIALFFLPALLGVGGRDPASSARPSVSAAPPSASPSPTPIPEPTAQTYTIKSGDTLSRIARANGLTLDQLLEANKDTISNPNRIAVGDVIIIPLPPDDGGASPSP